MPQIAIDFFFHVNFQTFEQHKQNYIPLKEPYRRKPWQVKEKPVAWLDRTTYIDENIYVVCHLG